MKYKFFDASGLEWCYDSKQGRVYCVPAEDMDIVINGTHQNGEYVRDLAHALLTLMNQGYMTK